MDLDAQQRILADGPVGLWATGHGTAAVLSQDEIEFLSDGSGAWRTHTAAFGPETVAFRWRMAGRALIEIRELPFEDDDPPVRLELHFEPIETDVGVVAALFAGAYGGFWLLPEPVVKV